ncbi:MAG: tail fiber protein [Verrucomicrobia bacterium]|nr:tail fiber protein [Verrucomicrobiota bacterium]
MKTTSLITKTVRYTALCLLAMVSILPALRAADANPPERMTYQGYLVDSAGSPLGSTNLGPKNYDAIFRIYNDQSLGGVANRVWTEQQTVTVDKGYFSAVLGEGAAYSGEAHPSLSAVFANLLDASERYIEITVRGIGAGGADSTILPRLRLVTSPYAFLARNAINASSLINSAKSQVVTVSGTSVGINNASPGSALDVNGTVTASGLTVNGTANLNGAVTASTLNVSGAATVGGAMSASTFTGGGTIPVGVIVMWSGATAPTGWALCDGGTYSGKITPDLRGRFVISSGNPSRDGAIGSAGGNASITLSVAQMPSHSHGYSDAYFSENQGLSDTWTGSKNGVDNDNSLYYRNGTTASAGSSIPIDIRPPFYVLAFIMRVQ